MCIILFEKQGRGRGQTLLLLLLLLLFGHSSLPWRCLALVWGAAWRWKSEAGGRINRQTDQWVDAVAVATPSSILLSFVSSRIKSRKQEVSGQTGWIMVMSRRRGAWWEWRWACGGCLDWIRGRLWKYEGLEFLSESYLKQINFLWTSVSLSARLSTCLSQTFKSLHFFCVSVTHFDWQLLSKGQRSASVRRTVSSFFLSSVLLPSVNNPNETNKSTITSSEFTACPRLPDSLIFMSCGWSWRSMQEAGECCPPLRKTSWMLMNAQRKLVNIHEAVAVTRAAK